MLRRAVLDAQNAARAALGVPALAWSESLAGAAARHAAELARTGRLQHASQSRTAPQGENLWAGARDAFSYADMVRQWLAEGRGRWQAYSHYTQVVWRGTTRVGCALAKGRAEDYLVCRYFPAGNIVGQRSN